MKAIILLGGRVIADAFDKERGNGRKVRHDAVEGSSLHIQGERFAHWLINLRKRVIGSHFVAGCNWPDVHVGMWGIVIGKIFAERVWFLSVLCECAF